MQFFIYALFVSIFFFEFLERYGLSLRQLTWLPELLSISILIMIVIYLLPKIKVIYLSPWYLVIFMLLAMEFAAGVILNQVPTNIVFLGIRNYLKYIPFFFLPVVYAFSDDKIKNQLKALLAIALIQIPVAMYQRFVESPGIATGDYVRGTFNSSSHLSIYLICIISILVAFRSRKEISLPVTILLGAALLFPTTINETKGTLMLLPVALMVPLLLSQGSSGMIKRLLSMIFALGVFLAIFVPVYDHFMSSKYDKSISHYVTEEGRLMTWLAPQTADIEGQEHRIGRIDVILSPFNEIDEPFKLLFGLGIGNVSESFLGEEFNGVYFDDYGHLMYLAFSHMVWEIGIIGTLLVLLLWFKIAMDAWHMRRVDGIIGTLATGWLGVMAVLTLSLMYKDIITAQALSYLFWFYGGYIATMRARSSGSDLVADKSKSRIVMVTDRLVADSKNRSYLK